MKAVVTTRNEAQSPLQGRVEGLDRQSLLGWAWHAERPAERLRVEALIDGAVVASATADGARVDLRRNGIGDGSHAFTLALPEEVPEAVLAEGRLVVRALAEGGETLLLRIPSTGERTAEAAVAAPAARIMERLDVMLAAQRQLHLAQREVAQGFRASVEKLDEAAGVGREIGTALETAKRLDTEMGERLTQTEGILARIDETLGGFDARLRAMERVGRDEGRAALLLLAVLSGTVMGAVLTFVAS
ncbi:hypothetical protein [Aureimonas sp. AU20]|uniref:hypothetical protein n=1 Tax=Aureimonas sp. AU20 TaxID=1349819 RepID=UPI000720E5AA|nr:hypothetical protein [Aureimonas sp. AU20]ALN72201.1 hypothetical protein M673_05705 [Aureimonas sp. AU20]